VASAEGERLLSAVRDRTGWYGQEASERQEQAPTRLYDQRGDGIRDASRLDAVLDDADDAVWLVPAMALTESTGEAGADRQESSVPTTQELDAGRLHREMVLENKVLLGSVNSNRRHFEQARASLSTFPDWFLAELVTGVFAPEAVGDAFEKAQDDIKSVIEFATLETV
jgi:hypothetical protein